jgi:anti-sigma regulatory factor (Ser/Thr protein kinase)
MSGVIGLSVQAALPHRDLVCRTVSAICKLSQSASVRADDTQEVLRFTHELVSAVGEAFNNVVLHAYADHSAATIDLEVHWSPTQVVVEMRDTGRAFDFHAAPAPSLTSPQERGMGLHIIRSFVDEVEYEPGPPNRLRLLKRSPVAELTPGSGQFPTTEGRVSGARRKREALLAG